MSPNVLTCTGRLLIIGCIIGSIISIEAKSVFRIGKRMPTDELVNKHLIATPISDLKFFINEPISYIEVISKDNILADIDIQFHNGYLRVKVSASKYNDLFQVEIKIYVDYSNTNTLERFFKIIGTLEKVVEPSEEDINSSFSSISSTTRYDSITDNSEAQKDEEAEVVADYSSAIQSNNKFHKYAYSKLAKQISHEYSLTTETNNRYNDLVENYEDVENSQEDDKSLNELNEDLSHDYITENHDMVEYKEEKIIEEEPEEEDNTKEEFPVNSDDKVIDIGKRQPNDHLLYETFQTSPVASSIPEDHSTVFYYIDSVSITFVQFVIYGHYIGKNISSSEYKPPVAEYTHFSDGSLKATITDFNSKSLVAQMLIFGYSRNESPKDYVPFLSSLQENTEIETPFSLMEPLKIVIASNEEKKSMRNDHICEPPAIEKIAVNSAVSPSLFKANAMVALLLILQCLLEVLRST